MITYQKRVEVPVPARLPGESTMTELKPCPCGQIPESLSVSAGSTYRWRYVSGLCCNEWIIEARVTHGSGDVNVYEECVRAWNSAPRGKE